MDKVVTRRFLVAIFGIVFVSVTFGYFAYHLNPKDILALAEKYRWAVGIICIGFFGAQSMTDIKKLEGGNNG